MIKIPGFAGSSLLALLALLALGLLPKAAAAEGWPQWRGSGMDGISRETGLAASWPTEWPVLWRTELPGAAASTPVVWGDRIFLTSTRKGTEELLVLSYDRSGGLVWQRSVEPGSVEVKVTDLAIETSPASPSPATDGRHVWSLFGTGRLLCHDFDGKLIWEADLSSRYGKPSLYFGMAASPLLHDGTLYVQLLHDAAQLVVALAADTGAELWKIQRATDATAESLQAYTTPVPFRPAGADETLILVHGSDYLTAHHPKDGREVWRFGSINPATDYNTAFRLVSTPAVAGDLIVVPTAQRGPVFGLRPGAATGALTPESTAVAWTLERANPDVPSPLVHEGLVYLIDKRGMLRVVEAESGEELFLERIPAGQHRASPVYADGQIVLAGLLGGVTVIEPGRKLSIVAEHDLGERLAASPVVAHGTLYLRTYEALYAVALKERAPKDG